VTMPDERTRAILHARQFLYELMDPKKTPKVSAKVRIRARQILKHFPSDHDMGYAADGAPSTFGHLEDE
jgi:hypothetical protein